MAEPEPDPLTGDVAALLRSAEAAARTPRATATLANARARLVSRSVSRQSLSTANSTWLR